MSIDLFESECMDALGKYCKCGTIPGKHLFGLLGNGAIESFHENGCVATYDAVFFAGACDRRLNEGGLSVRDVQVLRDARAFALHCAERGSKVVAQ